MEKNEVEKNFSIFKKPGLLTIRSNRFQEILEINPTFTINYSHEKKDAGIKLMDCFGIFGIITLLDKTYLIVITGVELSCIICKREIYKITDTDFIVCEDELINQSDIPNEIQADLLEEEKIDKEDDIDRQKLIQQLKETLNQGFYFSNKYDLANSFSSHNQAINAKDANSTLVNIDYDYIREGNRNFLANWKFVDKLILLSQQRNTKNFISNCIYGNIEEFTYNSKEVTDPNNEKIQIIVISRRDLWHFGIYNYRKGLSKNGYNSDCVETELIMIYNNTEIFTNVQISSYLPIYFKNKNNAIVNKAFIKFFKKLYTEYNLLLILGIDVNKSENDQKYFEKFKNLILKNKSSLDNKWKYFYIDNKQGQNAQTFLKDYKEKNNNDLLEILGIYHCDNHLKFKSDFTQIGAFYLFGINHEVLCENQKLLCYKIISRIYDLIAKDKIDKLDIFEKDIAPTEYNKFKRMQSAKIPKTNPVNTDFIDQFKSLFNRRKEALNSQYHPFLEEDQIKQHQRMIDILLSHIDKPISMPETFQNLKEEFSTQSEINIFVGTWNVGSTDLNKYPSLSLDSWLKPQDESMVPDIYFIGFEEVVELNAANVMLKITDRQRVLKEWGQRIENSLQLVGKYKKVLEMNLVGINLYFYVLEKDYEHINGLTQKFIKTGFGGASGNKGSCCISFNYQSTSISVACSHLAAGESKNRQRLKEISDVLSQKLITFVPPNESNKFQIDENNNPSEPKADDYLTEININSIGDSAPIMQNDNTGSLFSKSDIWFLFGDLNFRIDMAYEEFSEFIKGGKDWNKLSKYDQFIKNRIASLELSEKLDEDEITHPPSYKYILFSDDYDYASKKKKKNADEENGEFNPRSSQNLSGKKRNPSWCDRIFFKKNAYVTKDGKKIIRSLGQYGSIIDKNFQTSDHRPVRNIFNVTIFKEQPEKKNKFAKEIIINDRLNIKSNYMKKKNFDY